MPLSQGEYDVLVGPVYRPFRLGGLCTLPLVSAECYEARSDVGRHVLLQLVEDTHFQRLMHVSRGNPWKLRGKLRHQVLPLAHASLPCHSPLRPSIHLSFNRGPSGPVFGGAGPESEIQYFRIRNAGEHHVTTTFLRGKFGHLLIRSDHA